MSDKHLFIVTSNLDHIGGVTSVVKSLSVSLNSHRELSIKAIPSTYLSWSLAKALLLDYNSAFIFNLSNISISNILPIAFYLCCGKLYNRKCFLVAHNGTPIVNSNRIIIFLMRILRLPILATSHLQADYWKKNSLASYRVQLPLQTVALYPLISEIRLGKFNLKKSISQTILTTSAFSPSISVYNCEAIIRIARSLAILYGQQSFRLIIALYGPDSEQQCIYLRDFYASIDKHESISNIEFCLASNLKQPEWSDFLASSHFYIRLTDHDSYGLSCHEASLLGCQVIATNCGIRPSGTLLVDLGKQSETLIANQIVEAVKKNTSYRSQVNEYEANISDLVRALANLING